MRDHLYTVACAVCGRRDDTIADSHEEAYARAEEEKGWQIYRIEGTETMEMRCPKHWTVGKHD